MNNIKIAILILSLTILLFSCNNKNIKKVTNNENTLINNILEELCLVPVYINYYDPFPSVEYIGNGFKILEIIDDEYAELEWKKYMWDNKIRKYIIE
jgi:hypothetical protein